jgi:putative ABC transport system ATP-binding protein
MQWLLEAGPFSADDAEGRKLFEDAEILLGEAEAVVLDGPSGSGKSTLLRQLASLQSAPDAHRRLAGDGFAGRALPQWRARVTMLAQDAPVLSASVRDNLDFPFRLRVATGPFGADRARELLTAVGLERLPLDREVATLSGGERHRLALVRGLLWDPPVLLADEPLAGLDRSVASACFKLLLDFARRPGHALLTALHHGRLAELADRRIRLRDGRLEG